MRRQVATPFLDAVMLMLMVFVLLDHHPKSEPNVASRAPLVVLLEWKEKSEADIDLWVRGPYDAPISYGRKRGYFGSLLRDDRGGDLQVPERWEMIGFTRIPDGEYVINAHYYADKRNEGRQTISMQVWLRDGNRYRMIAKDEFLLAHVGHQITMLRFELFEEQLIPTSMHREFKRLRDDGEDDDRD